MGGRLIKAEGSLAVARFSSSASLATLSTQGRRLQFMQALSVRLSLKCSIDARRAAVVAVLRLKMSRKGDK